MEYVNKTEEMIVTNPKISYMYTNSSRGVECGDGWKAIIIDVLERVADLDTNKLFRIFVIKEKFGSLRIQYDYDYERSHSLGVEFNQIADIITEAEAKSAKVCERCGGENDAKAENRRRFIWLCSKCV